MLKDSRTYIILIGNIIPLVGFLFLSWELSEIYLFYLFELIVYFLVLLPKTVLFIIHKPKIYKYKRYGRWVTKKGTVETRYISEARTRTGQIISDFTAYIIFSIIMFALGVFFFCIHGFDPTYKTDINDIFSNILDTSLAFFKVNFLILIFILLEYLYGFFYYHIYKKEFLKIPYEYQSSESRGRNLIIFYLAVYFPLLVFWIAYIIKESSAKNEDVEFLPDSYAYHLLFLFSMFLFKTVTDLLVHVKKRGLLEKYGEKTAEDNKKNQIISKY